MQKFDRTHHKALWEYMAQEEIIMEIIAKSVDKLDSYDFKFECIYDIVRDFVFYKKMEFFVQNHILYNDIPINCCYACHTTRDDWDVHHCVKCPIDLKGHCDEDETEYVTKGNLYDRYIKYISHIVMKSKDAKKYIKQAQKMALQIANAKLRYEVEEI